MAFKMKNKAVMKMAKMAGDNRSAMKMKNQSAMKMAKKDSAMDMKKGSAMKLKTEKLDQVDLVGKRTKNQKFQKAIKEKHPRLKDMPEGHLYKTGQGDFKKKKGGKIVRRDDLGQGFKSGGGFFNRAKKEGLSSAIANTFPARVIRSIKRGESDR
jgi:hypothetical protein